jgi:DNA-binding Xre family transcriptional regulator
VINSLLLANNKNSKNALENVVNVALKKLQRIKKGNTYPVALVPVTGFYTNKSKGSNNLV